MLDHIIPPSSDSIDKNTVDKDLWLRLDAIVLQWIYGTISNDLLHTILEPDATAQMAWDHLKEIFQDNKHSRVVHVEHQFSRTQQSDFASVSAYCQHLKMLSDQLANVGAPVTNQHLVLQLVAGLSDAYDGVATIIQQSDPSPHFYRARNMLTLEESRKAKQASLASDPLSIVVQYAHISASYPPAEPRQHDRPPSRGRGRGRGTRGRRGRDFSLGQRPVWPFSPQQWQWPHPPCPYPTNGYSAPPWNSRANFQQGGASPALGLLGPRPQQAHNATAYPTYAPTDIETALHTLSR